MDQQLKVIEYISDRSEKNQAAKISLDWSREISKFLWRGLWRGNVDIASYLCVVVCVCAVYVCDCVHGLCMCMGWSCMCAVWSSKNEATVVDIWRLRECSCPRILRFSLRRSSKLSGRIRMVIENRIFWLMFDWSSQNVFVNERNQPGEFSNQRNSQLLFLINQRNSQLIFQ